ncbi:MAG: protein translocase subunit SecF [Salinibacterium sp.]|nr:protein translocase subunit SecF [Salinibacterium sp.]
MASLVTFGNDLYTGARSFDFVGKRRIWYVIAVVIVAISVVVPIARGGFVFGIEFRGGSEFQVAGVEAEPDQQLAIDTVSAIVADASPRVSLIGDAANRSLRVQTEQLDVDDSSAVRNALAGAYDVPVNDVASSFVGPSWGADISSAAIRALIVFIALAAIFMWIYFRTWKMSLAANLSLLHVMVITVGVYGIFGFEITPAAVIGFLTILGYSLYDSVVVFDKVRENTEEDAESMSRTFAESVNLAVNQTLVRSINTGVIAALPVAAILFVGAYLLGAGTLRDIALALFVGIVVATYSSIFIGAPVYAHLRQGEPGIKSRTIKVLTVREAATAR